jgi:hypothetical protein
MSLFLNQYLTEVDENLSGDSCIDPIATDHPVSLWLAKAPRRRDADCARADSSDSAQCPVLPLRFL